MLQLEWHIPESMESSVENSEIFLKNSEMVLK